MQKIGRLQHGYKCSRYKLIYILRLKITIAVTVKKFTFANGTLFTEPLPFHDTTQSNGFFLNEEIP